MSVNQALAEVLSQIAQLQELLGEDTFRAVSNARAGRTVADLPGDIAVLAKDRAKLMEIEGITVTWPTVGAFLAGVAATIILSGLYMLTKEIVSRLRSRMRERRLTKELENERTRAGKLEGEL